MVLVLIEICNICGMNTLCYDHICGECQSEREIIREVEARAPVE